MTSAVGAIALLLLCVLAEAGRELCFKVAAAGSAPAHRGYVVRVIQSPLVWGGMLLWVLETFAWVAVLGSLPLGIAFPLMALSYAAVPAAGVMFLGERLNQVQIAGAVLVMLGVGCVGWTQL